MCLLGLSFLVGRDDIFLAYHKPPPHSGNTRVKGLFVPALKVTWKVQSGSVWDPGSTVAPCPPVLSLFSDSLPKAGGSRGAFSFLGSQDRTRGEAGCFEKFLFPPKAKEEENVFTLGS